MKKGTAKGPDEMLADVWKSLGEEGVNVVWELMKKIYRQEKMPDARRESVIVPIDKDEGDFYKMVGIIGELC